MARGRPGAARHLNRPLVPDASTVPVTGQYRVCIERSLAKARLSVLQMDISFWLHVYLLQDWKMGLSLSSLDGEETHWLEGWRNGRGEVYVCMRVWSVVCVCERVCASVSVYPHTILILRGQ